MNNIKSILFVLLTWEAVISSTVIQDMDIEYTYQNTNVAEQTTKWFIQ